MQLPFSPSFRPIQIDDPPPSTAPQLLAEELFAASTDGDTMVLLMGALDFGLASGEVVGGAGFKNESAFKKTLQDLLLKALAAQHELEVMMASACTDITENSDVTALHNDGYGNVEHAFTWPALATSAATPPSEDDSLGAHTINLQHGYVWRAQPSTSAKRGSVGQMAWQNELHGGISCLQGDDLGRSDMSRLVLLASGCGLATE